MKNQEVMKNGILRLYNQFPSQYSSLQEMYDEHQRISELKFNAVWVNPLHLCSTNKIERLDKDAPANLLESVKGSCYAITQHFQMRDPFVASASSALNGDDYVFIDKNTTRQLKRYTESAKQNNLIPIFDIVLNHAAIDSPLVDSKNTLINGKTVDTSRWFLPHNLNDKDHLQGDDIRTFNYDDQTIREEIFEHLWKPYINWMISGCGFAGVRVDAARWINREVQQQVYSHLANCVDNPVIFAEVLYDRGKTESIVERIQGIGITHITNSIYWRPCDADARATGRWKNNDRFPAQVGLLRSVCFSQPHSNVVGGTVGFAGSHDEDTLCGNALLNLVKSSAEYNKRKWFKSFRGLRKPNIKLKKALGQQKKLLVSSTQELCEPFSKIFNTFPEFIQKLEFEMKQNIAMVAITSEGGWYLMSGDEYGEPYRKSVFNSKYYEKPTHPIVDLTDFIKKLNEVLEKLPQPTLMAWVEHIVVGDKPLMMVAIKHSKQGFEETSLILVNLDGSTVALTQDDKQKIAFRSQSLSLGNDQEAFDCINTISEEKIYCVGEIDISSWNSSSLQLCI